MKSIKDIEKLGLEEMSAISSDERIAVPEGFRRSLSEEIDALRQIDAITKDDLFVLKRRPARRLVWSLATASLVIAGTVLAFNANRPKDTFTDPYLAYAELEKAFAAISDGVSRGAAVADNTEKILGRAGEIINNLND